MDDAPWNLSAPPGFRGLDRDLPVTQYVRHLPHWRQDGATYFVTFRLGDALPVSKLDELRRIKQAWERSHPLPRSYAAWKRLHREMTTRIEQWLDRGWGSCLLANDWAARLVADALHYFDGARYELDCSVVMPNHVHAIVRPLVPADDPLERILHSWKSYTAHRMTRMGADQLPVWQQESYDRIIRDEEHLYRCIQYIGNNPARARRTREQCHCWLRPEWVQLGWRFEDP